MAHRVFLVEGSSTAATTVAVIQELIPTGSKTMVILDSDHSRDHVLAELRLLAQRVTSGCYLVVAVTALGYLKPEQVPQKRSKLFHKGDEPLTALQVYLRDTDRFEIDAELNGKLILSSSPSGYLRHREPQAKHK